MTVELTGRIKQVRFHNASNGFVVLNVESDQLERPILMTGYMWDLSDIHTYRFQGDFTDHPRYGYQFQFDSYQKLELDDAEALVAYLSSDLFKGIGPVFAREIVDTIGLDVLQKVTEDSSVLDHVKGMTSEKKEMLANVIVGDSQKQKDIQFLIAHGLSLKQVLKVMDLVEGDVVAQVKENPYCLIQIDGIGMKTCETLAKALSFPMSHPFSKQAHLLYEIKGACFNEGSTYLKMNDILKLPYYDHLVLATLQDQGELVEEDLCYYPAQLYQAEANIYHRLSRYLTNESDLEFDFEDVSMILEELQETWGITYDDIQEEAIYTFLENDLMILSGGPGTGKTTIVKAMLALYKKLYPHDTVALVAPTGRASKRLAEACELESSTIHRLLKWDAYRGVFNVTKDDPLMVDLVVVDEFSMVDTVLFSRLLDGLVNTKKILLIGDEAQLPSIAPGQVLADLITTEHIPTVFLKRIFRQKEHSGIIQVAHQIRNHSFHDVTLLQAYRDLHFIECKPTQIMYLIKRIASKAIKDGYDLFDFQVLYPKYQGIIGIDAINKELQELFNPPVADKKQIKFYHHIFREQDKVLQLKNRVDDHVFNGDLGIIIEIQKKDGARYTQDKMIVDFDGVIVEYTSDCFQELTLAYCMSIHKAQGSEFKIVVMPFSQEEQFMLNQKLIYTGMSRAKQSLYMLGETSVFMQGISCQTKPRNTGLKERFTHKELSPYDFLDS